MTKEIWRAALVFNATDWARREVLEKPTLEELLVEVKKYLNKDRATGKVHTYDLEKDECKIEHLVILDEMSIDKAVSVLNAKAVADKGLMKKIDKCEVLKQTVEDLRRKIRRIDNEAKDLTKKIHISERMIGSHVARDEPNNADNEQHQKLITKCRADRVKLKDLWASQDELDKKYKKLYAKKEKMRKELGI